MAASGVLRVARRLVVELLDRTLQVAPGVALTVVGFCGWLYPRRRHRETAQRYVSLQGGAAGKIARILSASEAKTLLFDRSAVRRPLPKTIARIYSENHEPLEFLRRSGGILATWHVGSLSAMIGGVVDAKIPMTIMVRAANNGVEAYGIELVETWDTPSALNAYRIAAERLREGRSVGVAVDAKAGTDTPPLTMLGQKVCFRRGAVALSETTGAAIIPMAARWRGTRIELVLGDPILPRGGKSDELRVAQLLADWLGAFLISSPEMPLAGVSATDPNRAGV